MVSCFSCYALAAVSEVVAVDDADPRERLALEMRHCLSRCEKLVCGRIELDLVQALQRLGTGSHGDGGFDKFFHFRAASGDEDGDELGRFLTDGL